MSTTDDGKIMNPSVELSRLVNLDKLYKRGLEYSLKATPIEMLALTHRFNIIAIQSLKANYIIEPGRTAYKGYYLIGHLEAEAIQSCVVSLVDVPENVNLNFELHIIDQKHQDQPLEESYQQDDIEYSEEGNIDLGEITAQYLSLSLNPYPRAVESLEKEKEDVQEDLKNIEKKNPFDILKSLKS
jgi:uncharacterized metal-binding protein YceD (DUF177 family)